jgi:hypothetical protein
MGRRRALTEQAAEAAVDQACRSLRLPTVRAWVTELADVAGEGAADLPRVPRRAAARRVRRPGTPPLHPTSEGRRVPAGEVLADFDFDANPAINPATIHTLATCAWVRAGDPLCLIGDSGTGKTHLLIGLGMAAAQAGMRVRYTLATKLANELVEAADERQLAKTIARYGRVDLLCIDLCRDRGYAEPDDGLPSVA